MNSYNRVTRWSASSPFFSVILVALLTLAVSSADVLEICVGEHYCKHELNNDTDTLNDEDIIPSCVLVVPNTTIAKCVEMALPGDIAVSLSVQHLTDGSDEAFNDDANENPACPDVNTNAWDVRIYDQITPLGQSYCNISKYHEGPEVLSPLDSACHGISIYHLKGVTTQFDVTVAVSVQSCFGEFFQELHCPKVERENYCQTCGVVDHRCDIPGSQGIGSSFAMVLGISTGIFLCVVFVALTAKRWRHRRSTVGFEEATSREDSMMTEMAEIRQNDTADDNAIPSPLTHSTFSCNAIRCLWLVFVVVAAFVGLGLVVASFLLRGRMREWTDEDISCHHHVHHDRSTHNLFQTLNTIGWMTLFFAWWPFLQYSLGLAHDYTSSSALGSFGRAMLPNFVQVEGDGSTEISILLHKYPTSRIGLSMVLALFCISVAFISGSLIESAFHPGKYTKQCLPTWDCFAFASVTSFTPITGSPYNCSSASGMCADELDAIEYFVCERFERFTLSRLFTALSIAFAFAILLVSLFSAGTQMLLFLLHQFQSHVYAVLLALEAIITGALLTGLLVDIDGEGGASGSPLDLARALAIFCVATCIILTGFVTHPAKLLSDVNSNTNTDILGQDAAPILATVVSGGPITDQVNQNLTAKERKALNPLPVPAVKLDTALDGLET